MKKGILLLLVVLSACTFERPEGNLVKEFVFNSKAELENKYGKSIEIYPKNAKKWKLKNNVEITVFYTDSLLNVAETLRIKNLKIDPLVFFYDLGWDEGNVESNKVFGKTILTDLNGIKEATFHKGANTLIIKLNNPKLDTFGKKS